MDSMTQAIRVVVEHGGLQSDFGAMGQDVYASM
jgi:hypothetical protein